MSRRRDFFVHSIAEDDHRYDSLEQLASARKPHVEIAAGVPDRDSIMDTLRPAPAFTFTAGGADDPPLQPLTPESVTNIPAWARNTRLLRTESVPTKPWWDDLLTVALMTAGIAILFILAILLEARNPN